MTDGPPSTATSVLLAGAVSLLALALPVGVAGVVVPSMPLFVVSLGLAGVGLALALLAGLVAGARSVRASRAQRTRRSEPP